MSAKRLTVVAAIIAVVAVASPGFAQGPKDCQSLAGSLAASLNLSEGGWSGTAFLAIGNAAPVKADLEDVSLDTRTKPPFAPFEQERPVGCGTIHLHLRRRKTRWRWRLTTWGCSAHRRSWRSTTRPARSPAGTGAYANASGNVTAHGPFIVALPSETLPPFSAWMAELKGTIPRVVQ